MNVERTYISLGAPRGIALTSLDKYLEQGKQGKRAVPALPRFPADDQADLIANLQKEQSRLCEELNAERRRNESMKATFGRAVALASNELNGTLETVKQILQAEPQRTPVIRHAIKYISGIQEMGDQKEANTNPSDFAQMTKEAEILSEKELKLNEALKKKLESVQDEVTDLEKEIVQAKKNLAEITESRKAMKEKCRTFIEQIKKRESQWKEKHAALEAELEAQD
jgi:predicted  nucleic acid-binding Zn-ribbon protein